MIKAHFFDASIVSESREWRGTMTRATCEGSLRLISLSSDANASGPLLSHTWNETSGTESISLFLFDIRPPRVTTLRRNV